MRVPILLAVACLVTTPVFAAPLSLHLNQPEGERPLKLEVSGSYGPSPVTIIFRDAMFGGLLGLAAGGAIGFASDSNHVGRDAAIGAGAGLLLGAVVGAFDAESSPRISVKTDTVFGPSLGVRGGF